MDTNSEKNVMDSAQDSGNMKAEWISPKEAGRLVSIGQTRLYDLINEGVVKSASLKNKGCSKGMRRINRESLLEYMDSLAN